MWSYYVNDCYKHAMGTFHSEKKICSIKEFQGNGSNQIVSFM